MGTVCSEGAAGAGAASSSQAAAEERRPAGERRLIKKRKGDEGRGRAGVWLEYQLELPFF